MEATHADDLCYQRPHGPSLLTTDSFRDPDTCRRQGGCQVLLQVFLSTHQSPPHSLIMP